MRIAVVGPLGSDSFADNIILEAIAMGHEVHALGPCRPSTGVRKLDGLISVVSDQERRIDHLRQRRMAARLAELKPDLVISSDRRLHVSSIRAAHSVGSRVVLWFPDHVNTMGLHDMFISDYDFIYLKNPLLVERLSAIQGLPVKYLPEAAHSVNHLSSRGYGSRAEIVMAGNVHPTRAVLLQRLLADGFPIKIYGARIPGWIGFGELETVHTGEYLAGQRKADVFRSAVAVLNNLHPAEFGGTNCRMFEAASAGAVVLTEDRPGLSALFENGKEVVCYRNYSELKNSLHNLLVDRDSGRMIGDAAADRVRREHTYQHRLASILADVG